MGAAVLVAAATTTFQAAPGSGASATRALWVTRTTLTSPESIVQMVRAADAGGFNTLLVQVRGRGDAYFDSSLEPRAAELASRPSFDPLATTIEQAHAAGLKVHAWVSLNLVSSAYELPPSRQHIVYRTPEWLMVPRELAAEMRTMPVRSPAYLGRLARWTRAHSNEIEGLYVSPVSSAAAIHTAAVIGDMARKYALDGVNLDYARYPSNAFDYGPAALEQFKLEILATVSAPLRSEAAIRERLDPLAYPNLFPDRWDAFRRSRLTALVMRVRTAIKAVRPGIVVSAAVVPDAQQAFDLRLQDWRTWLDESLVDVLCPMAYTPDASLFQHQVAAAKAYAGGRPVWAGIGAYRLTSAQTLEHIAAAQRLGTAGIILFSYDSLIAPPNNIGSLSALGRAAFGAGSH
ncbi:MAG: glycoside hydrolase family 10 protein [Vicinamibacterales bacterium]